MLKSEASLDSYNDSVNGLENLKRTVTIGKSIGSSEFSFAKEEEEEEEEEGPISPLIDKFDLFGNNETKFDLPSFEDEDCDGYYKRTLDEYPLHPLLLNNYAKFLEYKGDLSGAEEYYHKCTVVEPSDGVALANYGRLVMKLHQDEAKASSYFERAVLVSPEDSNVLAAYASFLWDVNADDDDEVGDGDGVRIQLGKEETEPEVGGKRSSRLSETEDGETLCRYAKAFWSISGDQEKALLYFEKAVKASPNDSIILGEYARFLWEIEE